MKDTKQEEQAVVSEKDKEHDHKECEDANRKYFKHGIIWLVAPTLLLILILVVYFITRVVAPTTEENEAIANMISLYMGFAGLIAVIGIMIGIPLGIINLSKRKYCMSKFDHRSGQGD